MLSWDVLAAVAMVAQPALPEQQVSPEHAPDRLNRLLVAQDYSALGETIRSVSRQADLRSDLDWLRARMLEGHSAFVTMLYSRLLWVAAGGLPDPHKGQMRQTAAMTTLYAHAAIAVDGARCGDPTAPSRRAEQLMGWNPEIWPFIASLTAEERQRLVQVAVQIEMNTASQRDAAGDIQFLCRYGLEETQYNLTHGTARDVPTPPGMVGRTVELRGDGGYVPSQRPDAEWRRRAVETRASLASQLAGLAGSVAGERGATPGGD